MVDVVKTPLDGLLLLKPRKFSDTRGFFYESFRGQDYRDAGITDDFVQDNSSCSVRNVLRGLHIQKSQAQILWPVFGTIYQVLLDCRKNSSTFGQHFGIKISHTDPVQVYMPAGFAGGFQVLSDVAMMNYKCSQYYSPAHEGGVLWSDPDLNIQWPVKDPIVSARDAAFPRFKDINQDAI